MATEFNAGSFVGRWLFALVLVLGTYNPTQWCYYEWATSPSTTFGPIVAIVGIVLIIGWIMFLRATFMSMGWLGVVLGGALFGCIVWLLVDQECQHKQLLEAWEKLHKHLVEFQCNHCKI